MNVDPIYTKQGKDRHFCVLYSKAGKYRYRWDNIKQDIFLFLLLHRACCRVTQLLHQPLHIYKIYKMYTLKH